MFMKKAKDNKKYYEKGKIDFLTFANDKRLAEATVIDFIGRAKLIGWNTRKTAKIYVWEFGIGNGDFAYNFLSILKKKNKALFKKTHYRLFDFSKKLLNKAKKRLKGFKNIEYVLYDAIEDVPKEKAHYMRINELWDDLPAKIFYMKGGKIFEKQCGKEMENEAAQAFLEILPEGFEIVINDYAAFHLQVIHGCLEEHGYIDVFDYGFNAIGLPKPMWNRYLRRDTNHTTYDVNFIYMTAIAKYLGIKHYIEPQDQFVRETLGKDLFSVELKKGLSYLSKNEMKRKRKELMKKGYSDEFIKGEINEESDYFHLRIWKD